MANQKSVNISLGVTGADAGRQEIEKIRAAAEAVGPSGTKSAQAMTDAFSNIERAADRVEKKISEGKTVTVRDGNLMLQQFTLLKNEIDRAFGSLNKAPAEIQAAFKVAESQFGATTTKVREMTSAMKDQSATIKGAAGEWSGFSDQFRKMLGPAGELVVSIGAVGGALTEGINIGMQFNKAIGADMSGAEQAAGELKDKIRLVIEQWAQGVVTMTDNSGGIRKAISLTANEFKGLEAVQAALGHELENYKDHMVEVGRAEQLYGQIQKDSEIGSQLLGKARKEGAGVLGEYMTSMELAGTIEQTHQKLVKLGSEGQRLWNEIYADGKGKLVDIVVAIENHKTAIADVTKLTKEEITAQEGLEKALNDTAAARVKAIDIEKKQVDLVVNQEKVEDGLTNSIRNKLGEINASMQVKEGREIPLTLLQIAQLETMVKGTMGLSDAERNHLQATIAKLKGVEAMTQGQRELLASNIQYDLSVNASFKADAAHVVVLDKKTHSAKNAAAGVDLASEANIRITRSSGEAVDSTHKLGGAFEKGAGPARSMGESIHMAGEGLQTFASHAPLTIHHINDLSIAANNAADAMERLATAQAKAASAGMGESGGQQ